MTADQWQRAEDLLEQALQHRPEARAAFLAQACRGDVDLRAEVESLLAHHEQASPDFMEVPEPPPGVRRLGPPDGPDPRIGQRIGQFRIEKVIAAGGMGTVYLARQEHPQREVALKVMKAGVTSGSALRRFEYESQILARLRHPNIAQVYEAATHDDGSGGVPYFAMEYIPDANTIIEYAEREKLGTSSRLELFAQVCEGVHHGHEKGIIHRDLKPGNILVDSDGRVKIIDFGVARATDADIALTTAQTDVGQLVGTLQYMSPEQCEADPHNIDTRSDVYALGVVLYELLCGQLPYDLSGMMVFEAARLIREQSPMKPSTISRELRGDVETIVLKALEKERGQRYVSAAELGDDIRRYLSNEPITARPPSTWYQLRKFTKRNRVLVGAVAAVFVALVAGTAGTISGWLGAIEARTRAHESREEAVLHAYAANIAAAQAALEANDAGTARRMLDEASEYLPRWEWRHLKSRVDQSLRTVVERGGPTSDVAVHPDGNLIAIVRPGVEMVCLVDVATGETVQPLPGDSTGGECVAFSHDGSLLAVAASLTDEPGDSRKVISLWRRHPAGDYRRIANWYAHETAVTDLAFSPGGSLLASGSDDETIKLWAVDRLERHQRAAPGAPAHPDATLRGHTNGVRSVAFSPDGILLASGARDYTVRLWDVSAARGDDGPVERAVLRGHAYYIQSVAFSPDGTRLASGSTDSTIRLWDVWGSLREADEARQNGTYEETTGITLDTLHGHTAGVMSVAFDSTGTQLASGAGDRTVRVWNLRDVVSDYQRTHDWEMPGRHESTTLRGHEDAVNSVHVLSDGRILSHAADGTIREWSPDVCDVPQLRGHVTSLRAVTFTPDGRYVISAADSNDDSLIVWDADRCVPVARRYLHSGEGIEDMACLRHGGEILLAAVTSRYRGADPEFGRVLLWLLDSPEQPIRIEVHKTLEQETLGYISVAVSSNGNRLAAGTTDGTIEVWDITDLSGVKRIATLKGHTGQVNSVVFLDHKGLWLASASGVESQRDIPDDDTLRVWDVDDSLQVDSHADHIGVVFDLALSDDGSRLASASEDKTVRLWSVDLTAETPQLELVEALTGHTDAVHAVAFHPVEARLISGSQDGMIKPVEARLISGSQDGMIKVWDLETMVEVATLRGQAGGVTDLAFDPAGRRLASASEGFHGTDNVARLWETDVSSERRKQRGVCMRAHDEVERILQTAVPTLAEAKQHLVEDKRLPEDVRAVIRERFEHLLPHARWIDWRGRVVAQDPDRTGEEYERGLDWSRTAVRLAPENGCFLTTIGMLQCRLGDYAEAVETLGCAVELNGRAFTSDRAFVAMAHWKLGHAEDARAALKEARAAMEDTFMPDDERNPDYLDEAESLISGDTAPEADAP